MDALDRHAMPVSPEAPRAARGDPTRGEPASPRWLRIAFAATSFVGFGLGALLLSVTVLPLAWIASGSRARGQRRCRHLVAGAFRFFLAYMRTCGLVAVEVRGVPPARGPVVAVANHPTLIDVTAILASFPDLCCIVKPAVAYNPLFLLLIHLCGHVSSGVGTSLGAGIRTFGRARRRLAEGVSVLVFPEGTRSPESGPLPFQRGAFELAARAQVPLLPIRIEARPSMLQKGTPWYRIPRRMARLGVAFLPEVTLHLSSRTTARELARRTRQLLVGPHEKCAEDPHTRHP
jgi:1-acyl-sn-glycerol-3-phosphate acyltransferase